MIIILCTDKGRGAGNCPIQHIELPRPGGSGLASPKNFGTLRGLSSLQASRTEWITEDAVFKALWPYHDSLPLQVRQRIVLPPSEIVGLFDPSSTVYEQITQPGGAGIKRYRRWFRIFAATEYVIWPINYSGNHWELVVIHKQQAENGDWTHVSQIAVIDAWKNEGNSVRKQQVHTRLEGFLKKMNMTFALNYERSVWAPWQRDLWSCGMRTYWAARQMMDRILKFHEDGLTYSEKLWEPLSGWFNVDFVRWEMIGLNAYFCVKDLDYRARVAVELVNQVQGDNDEMEDAGDTMRPLQGDHEIERPPIAQQPVPSTPNKRKKREHDADDSLMDISSPSPVTKFAPVPVPNERRIAPSRSIDRGDQDMLEGEGENANPIWSRSSPERTGYPRPSGSAP